jgi:hypothetical protein
MLIAFVTSCWGPLFAFDTVDLNSDSLLVEQVVALFSHQSHLSSVSLPTELSGLKQ